MGPAQFIIVTIDREDEAEYAFLITHTHPWDKDAVEAIQNHITKWLLTPAGRSFVRKQPIYQSTFPWSEMLGDHPEVIASTPGITKIEYLPYMIFAIGPDDHPEPWSANRNPTTGKRVFQLDHNMIETLLDEEKQHAEQHG